MSIRKYIAYLRTVETGSITQAANELGYTQSAVSKMISDLEQDWQVKLLTRNHSGIEISSDGMVLLPTIREIVKDYEDLNFAVSELHGVQSGHAAPRLLHEPRRQPAAGNSEGLPPDVPQHSDPADDWRVL